MWHLNKIPKIAHFYWGGKRMSYLQFMSICSFWRNNPEWKIKLHTSYSQTKKITWDSKEQEYQDNYDDFSVKITELPIEIKYHNFKDYGFSENLSEVHKSDILRLKVLAEEGGVYSDTDVLYIRPIEALSINKIENSDRDTVVSICYYGHSIGFLMSSPKNQYFSSLYKECKSRFVKSDLPYQYFGVEMINRKYIELASIPGYPCNIEMNSVYPFDATKIFSIFKENDLSKITEQTVGIHWYAGHPLAGEFLNSTNGGRKNLPNCILSTLLKKQFVKDNILIPSKYSKNKIFLLGQSGVGKTTLARNYSSKYDIYYCDFDIVFGLIHKGWIENKVKEFLSELPESFITEHIPLVTQEKDLELRYKDFLDYASKNEIQVVIVTCKNKEEHIRRLKKKGMVLDDLNINYSVVDFFKSKGLKIDYYDTSSI